MIPDDGMNGPRLGRLSRRAQRFENAAAFADYRTARRLPKDTQDESRRCGSVHRTAFETAVFDAMRAVEITVREKARLGPSDHGDADYSKASGRGATSRSAGLDE